MRPESRKEILKRRAAHRMRNIARITKERLRDEYEGVLYDERGVSVAGPPQVIIPKVDPSHVIRRQNHNLRFALDFGQSLVLDMGPSEKSNPQSFGEMQGQCKALYSENRTHSEPFNIHLCNASKDSPAHRPLLESASTSSHLWNASSECFTSLFPKERILYLTPESKNAWTKYKHDDVIVLSSHGRGNMALIKKHKLRSARLDLSTYFVNRQSPNLENDADNHGRT